jgi:Flp pilus assembly protein TadG
LELAVGGLIFFTTAFALIECSRLLWTHNALTDAVRRGARYAVLNSQNSAAAKNVVVYGVHSPSDAHRPVVNGLTQANVNVVYNDFGLKQGTVTVSITNYAFHFTIPWIGGSLTMSDYSTTLTGESAGYTPPTI